jgi:hypothetical protein
MTNKAVVALIAKYRKEGSETPIIPLAELLDTIEHRAVFLGVMTGSEEKGDAVEALIKQSVGVNKIYRVTAVKEEKPEGTTFTHTLRFKLKEAGFDKEVIFKSDLGLLVEEEKITCIRAPSLPSDVHFSI